MSLVLQWVLFPLVLSALCLGIALLLEAVVPGRLPGVMLVPVGFAALIGVVAVTTSTSLTAPLSGAVVVFIAIAGFGLGRDMRRFRPDPWIAGAALGVFAAYAAPLVLSGEPGFAGYIKLDDTSTWLAFVDQLMSHGHDFSTLNASTHEATIQINFSQGYPVGAFLPLGIGTQLTGQDPAWLFQPYMAFAAALIVAPLVQITESVISSVRLRAGVAFIAAQAALLYGYSLWGGIKEVVAATLLATLPALVLTGEPEERRIDVAVLSAGLAAAAIFAVLGAGGVIWLAFLIAPVLVVMFRASGLKSAAIWTAVVAAVVLIVNLPPVLAAGSIFSPTQGPLTSANELGNLIGPLDFAQIAGVWPSADFRVAPSSGLITAILVAIAIGGFAWGIVASMKRRSWQLLLYVGGVILATLLVWLLTSPWVGAKALASAAPAFLCLAMVGVAALLSDRRWRLAAIPLLLLPLGVVWSNALAYHEVWLAPYGQLRELEKIGDGIRGQGPTLMTEYQPYGVRHLLRKADAEGVSELRRRVIPLRDGTTVTKGAWADTDQLSLPDLLIYRTLVLRHDPSQSRPPSPYELVRPGRYYDVWQRPADFDPATLLRHLPLGEGLDPASVADCPQVRRLARVAGPGGRLVAVPRPAQIAIAPGGQVPGPGTWPVTDGPVTAEVGISQAGEYRFFLGGSARGELTLSVDGREVGAVRQWINPGDQYLELGTDRLAAGSHEIKLSYGGSDLHPGSGAPADPLGPMILVPVPDAMTPFVTESRNAGRLCNMRLDWIEAQR